MFLWSFSKDASVYSLESQDVGIDMIVFSGWNMSSILA